MLEADAARAAKGGLGSLSGLESRNLAQDQRNFRIPAGSCNSTV